MVSQRMPDVPGISLGSNRKDIENRWHRNLLMISARPNVVRILAAMQRQGWGVKDTCVNCSMNNKTLSRILRGEMPSRIDAIYRLSEGLKIPIEQILINGTAQPNLTLIEGRKQLLS